MGIKNDYGDFCGHLLLDVLEYFFVKMADEGTLESLFNTALKTKASECPKEELDEDPETQAIDAKSMGGILVMHALGVVISFVFYFIHKYTKLAIKRDNESGSIPSMGIKQPAEQDSE